MLKFFPLIALIFAAPALAAPQKPAPAQIADPLESLLTLDKELNSARIAPKSKTAPALEEFREELQLSANGKSEVELEKIPAAPEDDSGK